MTFYEGGLEGGFRVFMKRSAYEWQKLGNVVYMFKNLELGYLF